MRGLRVLLVVITVAMVAPALAQTTRAPAKGSAAPARSRRYLKSSNPAMAPLPFSDGVLVGDTLYLAGRIGVDPKTGQAPADVDQEIRLLLDGMKTALAQGGMSMDDLVFVQVFCPDLSLYEKFNAAYRGYFGKEYPARSFVGSGPLLRGGHFEMNGIAVKR